MANPYNPNDPLNYAALQRYYSINGSPQQPSQSPEIGQPPTFYQPPLSSEVFGIPNIDYDALGRPLLPNPPPSTFRGRKKVGAGGEPLKFKRTRSGCFTCRQRRVKCDEERPSCKKCLIGKRECAWPDNSESSRSKKGPGSKSIPEEDEISSQDGDEEVADDIPDDEDVMRDTTSSPVLTRSQEQGPVNAETTGTPSLTPVVSNTSSKGSPSIAQRPRRALSYSKRPALPSITSDPEAESKRIAELPQDIRFFLNYARQNLSSAHYGFKFERNEFLRTKLISAALQYEPLLYAVVGFAAYHYTILQPDGKISHFLDYYNKSVSALRKALVKDQKQKRSHSLATLMTILQLATIEEFLGDWVNCLTHTKAASQIIKDLYTPESMAENDSLRMIFHWYIRYDVFSGVMSGQGTVLGMEWLHANHDHLKQRIQEDPDDILSMYEERYALLRVLASKIACLCGDRKRGVILDDQEFARRWDALSEEIAEFEQGISPVLLDTSKKITMQRAPQPYDSEDIIDAYEPELLFGEDIFMSNLMLVDYWMMDLMFNEQLGQLLRGKPRTSRGVHVAMQACQVIEAIEYCPESPQGALLACQTAISIAARHLPKDDSFNMWSRRKLAAIEVMGYILPQSYRLQMADYWNADATEIMDWWLPDQELRPSILKDIKEFITERQNITTSTCVANEDIRDMRGIFSKISLNNSENNTPSPDSSSVMSNMDGASPIRRSLSRRQTGMSESSVGRPTSASTSGLPFGPPTGGSGGRYDLDSMLLDDTMAEFHWDLHENQPWDQS